MGSSTVVIAVITAFFAFIGIVLPIIVGRGENKGVIRCFLVISAASCWLFWLCCYMHQMNPLIGPEMHATTVVALKYLWDGDTDFMATSSPHAVTEEAIFATSHPELMADKMTF